MTAVDPNSQASSDEHWPFTTLGVPDEVHSARDGTGLQRLYAETDILHNLCGSHQPREAQCRGALGVLAFFSLEEAQRLIDNLEVNHPDHQRAARATANGNFSFETVLPRLLAVGLEG
jgi:hypothetical protein